MERLGILQLAGVINEKDPDLIAYCRDYLGRISQALGEELTPVDKESFAAQGLPVFFLASGGSASLFRDAYQCVEGPYILLTTAGWNSLPASMEILGFLQGQGLRGEILHGEPEEIAPRLRTLLQAARARRRLAAMRLGVIGETQTLVSSRADAARMAENFGARLVMVEIEELVEEFRKGGYEANEHTRALLAKGYDPAEMEKALNVYGATQRLIAKYDLNAVTVRCFDLLGSIGTTGCLALAILNAQGIPAACEGDTRSLLSMAVLHQLTGEPVFMANPSQLDRRASEMDFAHCTLPMNMPRDYTLTTHFESGIGVALAADFEPGPVTVFKCDENGRFYAQNAWLKESLHRPDLCRTQLRVQLPEGTDYFTGHPIANHQMVCKGHWAQLIQEFFGN